MNSLKTIFFIALFALFMIGCGHDSLKEPLNFKAYHNNPVLSPGVPGSWDELFVWTPQIVFHENVYYLFYMGSNIAGRMAVGVATSADGFNFIKYPGNPILSPDNKGLDAFTVGPGIILKDEFNWVMYYNEQELASFAPGRYIGRATSVSLTGPWIKDELPVISSGVLGEWDAGFIIPGSVLKLENDSYVMYYTAGKDLALFDDFYVGMATSPDGINWKKYNDASTSEHPFAASDPVMTTGKKGEWDCGFVWMPNVTKNDDGYRMYYSASDVNVRKELKSIGYSTSRDGIHWKKYAHNPVYSSSQDPFALSGGITGYIENPALLYHDTRCLMYYECGPFNIESTHIAVAIGRQK